MTGPERRRRRPTTACVACRKRKTRCNRGSPCSNCSRSRKKEACVYEPDHSQPEDSRPGASAASAVSTINGWGITPTSTAPSTCASNAVDPVPLEDVVSLKNRIRCLEEQLDKSSARHTFTTLPTGIETSTSQIGGTFHIHYPSPSGAGVVQKTSTLGQAQAISRSLSHKTRLLGQSHWANTVAPLASCSSY